MGAQFLDADDARPVVCDSISCRPTDCGGTLKKPAPSYFELIRSFPLASIQSESHYHQAQEQINDLVALHRLDSGQKMYLDALCDLVASYEDVQHAIQPASDADLLAHLLESRNLEQVELSKATGIPKSSISEVLSGKKQLTKQMIQKLAE